LATPVLKQIDQIRSVWLRGDRPRARALLRKLAWTHPSEAAVAALQRDTDLEDGQFDSAVEHARRVVSLAHGSATEVANLGTALYRAGRQNESADELAHALAMDPTLLSARRLLLLLLHISGRTIEILRYASEGTVLHPQEADLVLMTADAQSRLGEADRAAETVGRALLNFPSDRRIAEVHCYLSNNSINADRERVFRAHQNFGRLVSQTLGFRPAAIETPRDPTRRLRVGIVSGDFRRHSVWHFITPWLEHANRGQFEIVCISTGDRPDRYTEHQRSLGHGFVQLDPGPYDACIAQLRSLNLDVIVELAGLTGGTKADLLHLRAAPVQVTYIGYPNTTGIANIDWRIVDSVTDPAEAPYCADRYATERLCRLDPCFLCYRPPLEPDLPAQGRRPVDPARVVFGSFNAAWKVTAEVLLTWGELLRRVPGAQLHIKSAQIVGEPERANLLGRCAAAGIDPARVSVLAPPDDNTAHLRMYDGIDIALDAFPYQGTTTTCEALLMGVPVVTVSGLSHASRVGASLLNAAGLPELAAPTIDQYITTAADLAADHPRLTAYHRTLRDQLLASPLCDGPAFSRRLEDALRTMWRAYCAAP